MAFFDLVNKFINPGAEFTKKTGMTLASFEVPAVSIGGVSSGSSIAQKMFGTSSKTASSVASAAVGAGKYTYAAAGAGIGLGAGYLSGLFSSGSKKEMITKQTQAPIINPVITVTPTIVQPNILDMTMIAVIAVVGLIGYGPLKRQKK